jgi:hypothetical protein
MKMNWQEFQQFCRNQGVTPPGEDSLKTAKEFNTSVCCHLGNWYPDEELFRWWGITPSSEDKGYSTY